MPDKTIDFMELDKRARDILANAGLVIDGPLDWSGKLAYCGTSERPNSTAGRYILHADFPQNVCWFNYHFDGGEKHVESLLDGNEKMTKAEREALARTISEGKKKRAKELAQIRAAAAQKAKSILDASPIAGDDNAYLHRKGVPACPGLKQGADGALLVPVSGPKGIQSMQTISADGEKRFLSGGAIQGGFFPIPAKDGGKKGTLLIGEGFATCMSAHLATGYAALSAFNAGNLDEVAGYARSLYPEREIILLADNDCTGKEGNPRPIEKNTGVQAARAAGAAIGAAVAVCPSIDGRSADFNDLHTRKGLDAVRDAIEAARGIIPLPERFYYEGGKGALMYLKPTGRDDGFTPVRICEHIEFTGRTYGEAWGYLFSFRDRLDRMRNIAIPARLFQLPGAEWAAMLADNGLDIEGGMQKAFKECCLAMRDRLPLVRNVERTGWSFETSTSLPAYVLPDSVYSAGESAIVFQSGTGTAPGLYTQAGTLDGWKEAAELCAGNTRLIFSLCVSFAGTLLHLAGVDGGVFHLEGGSTTGKTTSLRLAASVWGNPNAHMRTWRTTDNGLESLLPLFNDNSLSIDELGQVDARALSESAYMIANGSGKTRANRQGGARTIATWRTVLLSSGELNLAAKLAEDGHEAKAGQQVRFVGIPLTREHLADLHGMTPAELTTKIRSLSELHYGVAGRAFLTELVKEMATLDFSSALQGSLDDEVKRILPQGADGQVQRVARRFALVFVAGQYAQWFKVLPPSLDVQGAVESCFNDWLKERGSAGEQESRAILEQVRSFLEKHGQSRFQDTKDTPSQLVINRAGFKDQSEDGTTFYIFPDVFKREVIKGYSLTQAKAALNRAGWITTQASNERNGTISKRLPGMSITRVYAIRLMEDNAE